MRCVSKGIIFFMFPAAAYSQELRDTITLSLTDVVVMAREKSITAKQASARKETRYWEWRTHLSNYQPQLSVNGVLPAYNKTFYQVLQPDGSILFQPIHNNNSLANISFSQGISATGGTVFGTSELQRFDNFDTKAKLYNASPFAIGYIQPLWQFNELKWNRRIEPLKYKESQQAYIESMEQCAVAACGYFFDLLFAQVNLQIAKSNLTNTGRILKIADEKLEIGKISRNEILQLRLEELKARKAVGTASRDVQIAVLNLGAYIGLNTNMLVNLKIPGINNTITIDPAAATREAFENRSDAIAFNRKRIEAERDIAKAKGANGINASLNARMGFSNSAAKFARVYNDPKSQQQLELTFTVPILDWGRSKSRIRTAEVNEELVRYELDREKQVFTQQIITQVSLFEMMKDQVELTKLADDIANEKYTIAQERYVIGNLSITDLSIAFQEKDQAKRDYIAALKDYWSAYFQIRYLSLYDFEQHTKILAK